MSYNINTNRRIQDNSLNPVINEILSKVPEFISREKDPNGNILINCAEKMGEFLAKRDKITSSQVRNLFNEVKQINFNKDGPYKINLLKAKFAYIAGRFKEIKNFRLVADEILSNIGTDEEKFKRFQDFFEAVVAYHRVYGGKE